MLPALLCAVGLPAGFLLIRRIPRCSVAMTAPETSVSIVIPARNEAQNLPHLLKSIAFAGSHLEVLVVDDDSTDDTAAVASGLGAKVLRSAPKPTGWTGKCWACFQGAQSATGELLLFLDADTSFQPGGLDRMIYSWMRAGSPNTVLSVLPYHAMKAPYEQLALIFNILMAAGAGGFGAVAAPRLFGQSLLISRSLYFKAGGHAAVADVVLENLRWAGLLRQFGAKIICLGGQGTLHMRMFPDGLGQMSRSWTKAFVQGASDSGSVVLTISIVWISSLCSTTLLLLLPHDYGRLSLAVLYLLLGLQMTWIARQLGNYRAFTTLLFPISLAYYCVLFGGAALRGALGRKTLWKGREV
jgi:4,4'-diaponeurosporenoate glycosyltransferase